MISNSEIYEKYINLKDSDPSIGSRKAAKKIIEENKELEDKYNVETLSSFLRTKHLREKNKFTEAIEEGGFNEKQDWDYGWLKTKKASVFIKNPNKVNGQGVPYERFRDDFIEEMKSYSQHVKMIQQKPYNDPHLLVIDLADLHIGKLASLRATGEEYNVDMAIDFAVRGVEGIIQKSSGYEVDAICFVIGNDVLHVDTVKNTTTKGTPQDTDGMWYDNFVKARKLYVAIIESLAEKWRVHVVHSVSNHDVMSGFMLADSISCYFYNNENVTFDTDMKHRKYYQYGKNLIGFTHGDGAKMDKLPLLMANEAKAEWAETTWRYFLCHHIHHKNQYKFHSGKDYEGVTVEYMRSPSSADDWHARNGYQHAPKAIEGFLFHPEYGQVSRITHLFD